MVITLQHSELEDVSFTCEVKVPEGTPKHVADNAACARLAQALCLPAHEVHPALWVRKEGG